MAATSPLEGARPFIEQSEIIELHLGRSETEPFWTSVLHDLVECGLKLVISDGHDGVKALDPTPENWINVR
jgi:hypothetical protein